MPQSSNIEDRRGQRGGAVGAGGLGIGAIVVIFAISYFTGISPQVLMSGAEMMGVGQQSAPPQSSAPPDPNDPMRVFLSKVVGGTEAVWAEVLPAQTVGSNMCRRRSSSMMARPGRDAAAHSRRWGRLTARSTRRFTSTLLLSRHEKQVRRRR